MSTEQTIFDDAAAARARDAGQVTAPVTEGLEIPAFLLRALDDDQHEQAWKAYCVEHGITPRARARGLESQNFSAASPTTDESSRDLRAEQKRLADEKRIAKMKAGIEKKAAVQSGATKTMPLSGREALAAIRGTSHD